MDTAEPSIDDLLKYWRRARMGVLDGVLAGDPVTILAYDNRQTIFEGVICSYLEREFK